MTVRHPPKVKADRFRWVTWSWATGAASLLWVLIVVQSLSYMWLLATHGLQDARHPCPPLSPEVCSDSWPLSWWCYPILSSLCCSLFLLPSTFPSISVFSNESALRIRWPKYWSFNFSISSSNDYSGLISFRMDWFDLLAVHPDTQIKSGEWGDWRRVNYYELKRYRKTAPWAYVSVPPSLVSKAMLLVYLGIVSLGNTHKWSLKKG